MAVSEPLTPAELEQIRELHAAGKGRNDIARALKRSGASISKACVDMGLPFDRTAVQMATEARKADAAARRALLEIAYLEEAHRLVEEVRAPAVVYNFGGKENTYEERLHDEPDAASKLKLMQASGVAVDRALRIAEHDAETGMEQARSMLSALGRALGITPPADA